MQQLIFVALGGSLGAVCRFIIANGFLLWLGRGFPYGTLFINVTGSLLMGLLSEVLIQRFPLTLEYRSTLLIGFLGAYTTFSSFSLETLNLLEAGNLHKAFLNSFLNVTLSLLACWLGLLMGRNLLNMIGGDKVVWLALSLPYLILIYNLIGSLLLSIVGEIYLQQMNYDNRTIAAFYITLLATQCTLSIMWFVFKQAPLRLEAQDMLNLFACHCLFGAMAISLGRWLGRWLWQLAPVG